MNNTIETKDLTKRFGKNTAVQSLNLTVPTGSIFAFLGPNGAGKTTTIKTLMNIMKPTQGSSTVLGVDSKRLGPKEFAQIGYVSENQEMPDWMTIKQFLNYCKNMYSTWDDKFCNDLTDQFNLPLDQQLKSISRGMKMKAALISSLAYRPKLLIFDEPFSGLDPLVRDEFITGMLDITEDENWTIFISSHDIDEVERLADWVGIIDKGVLKVVEKTEDLQNRFRRVELTLCIYYMPCHFRSPKTLSRYYHNNQSCDLTIIIRISQIDICGTNHIFPTVKTNTTPSPLPARVSQLIFIAFPLLT